jgi:ATP-binding cassette subfamily B protein
MRDFKQHDVTDCGACCLGFIAARVGKVLPVSRLRQLTGTNRQGTTALGLVEAARVLGLTARAVKGTADQISGVPLPAVVHCLVDQRLLHYVVLVKWTPRYAKVMDPTVGRVEKWSREEFTSVWTGVLILVAPGENFEAGDRTVPPVRRLWRLLQPQKNTLIQAFVGAMVSTILALGMSVYIQKIVDNVIPDGNRPLLNLLGVAMLAVVAFKLVLGVFQSLLSLRMAQKIDASLILAYYRHLLRLPQPFFDSMRVGEITARVADALKVRNFLNNSLLNLVLNPLILVFALAAMFFYSWKLALLSLTLVPLNAAVYWAVNHLNRAYQRRIMERAADFDAQLVESLNAQGTVRRFGLEELSSLKTEIRLVRLLKTTWRAAIGGLSCTTAATLLTQVYLIALLWLGAALVLDARLSPGELMSGYTLAGFLTAPMAALIGLNTTIQEALVATDRLFEIMDLELETDQGAIEFTHARAGDIRFEGITYKYAGRLATLENVSFCAQRGRITALAGESGCGKSTLLALLQRLYSPAGGRILIGDLDLSYLTLASLRRGLAVVPQQTALLSGTVLENLAPGEFQPDMERLLKICREAGVLDFIEKLPQGFFTHLNENGANLSGGQRQRLALVRAFYRDAPILVLDEPSAGLDAGSEDLLMRTLRRLRDAGTTILLVAHDPRLLRIADRVVTLAGGRVVAIEPVAGDLHSVSVGSPAAPQGAAEATLATSMG